MKKELPQVLMTTNGITALVQMLHFNGYTEKEIYEAMNGDVPIGAIRRALIRIEKEQV